MQRARRQGRRVRTVEKHNDGAFIEVPIYAAAKRLLE